MKTINDYKMEELTMKLIDKANEEINRKGYVSQKTIEKFRNEGIELPESLEAFIK